MRTVERLEGLALVGLGSIGPLSLPTPGLLEPLATGQPRPPLCLEALEAPLGSRRLRLSDAAASVEIDYAVPAPEILGPTGGVSPAGPHALLVRPPWPTASERPVEPARSAELLVWGNARSLWADGLPFVQGLAEIRAAFGASPVLWAPRVALPHRIPFLVYLGVDLIDPTEGLLAAARGVYLDPVLGTVDATVAREEGRCACDGCKDGGPDRLARHAIAAYRSALTEARTAARSGRLRELVETRLPAEPALAEMLRYADRELARLLEERTPVTGSDPHAYVLLEAHRRPEMERFRRRLLERYAPPPSKTVLLLVPCSRTKPYRLSRSHRRFSAALDGLAPLERVHRVSLSSPIGLVPRELEDMPPARHYDIPVTGDWEERERRAVVEGLLHLLDHGRYRAAVVHLDPEEYGFLRDAWPSTVPAVWSIADGRSTSLGSLAALREAVGRALEGERPVEGGPLAAVREELKEVAAFQFGRAEAERLFAAPIRLAGRPWFQRLTDGKTDLATLREERGLFHLTVAGARRLLPSPPLAVEVEPTLPLTGDLFAPGVRRADPGIRAGDSVVLLRDGALAGVGEAALPGPLMTQLRRGVAVRVRHREHAGTDTTIREERSTSPPGPVV